MAIVDTCALELANQSVAYPLFLSLLPMSLNLSSSQPQSTPFSYLDQASSSTANDSRDETLKAPIPLPSLDRALPEVDSVALALESAFARSRHSLRVHNDQLDERTLLWTILSIHSPVSKISSDKRYDLSISVVESVFPGLMAAKAEHIHLLSRALTTPQSYLYLLREMRLLMDAKDVGCVSDYVPASRWLHPLALNAWRLNESARISELDKQLSGDSSIDTLPPPVLVLQLLQTRHLSLEKFTHPKSLSVTVYVASRAGNSEKRKMVGIKTSVFGTATLLDSTPHLFHYGLDFGKKAKKSSTHAEVMDFWASQQAELVVKVRDEHAISKINSGTIGKLRLPLVELFQKYRANDQEACGAHWCTLGTAASPELLLKTVFVLPSDHLKLDPSPIPLSITYSRLSNRLFATGKSAAAQHTHAILESFAALFGISSLRVQLASLESHLLFGDSRLAIDRMVRILEQLEGVIPKAGQNPEGTMVTVSEASLYRQLLPAVQKYAIALCNNCVEAFPNNFPSGSLKRALQLAMHFWPKNSSSELLSKELRVNAALSFYRCLYPNAVIDESLAQKTFGKGVDSLRGKKLPHPLSSFAPVHQCLKFVKNVVEQHELYFNEEFKAEAKVDATRLYVDTFVELLAQVLCSYFMEGHHELTRERRGSSPEQAEEEEAVEHRLVFQSVDAVVWLMTSWQKHTAKDLKTLIPIYDYLEHGTQWWLESLNTQMQRWAAEVLVVDDFEPMDLDLKLLHSQSVVHLFSISHEALGVITPILAKWTKPTALDHLEYFVQGFCKSAEMYCLNVEAMFTQQTSTQRERSKVPTSAEEKRVSTEQFLGKRRAKFVPPVAIKSLFAPILRSPKFNQFAGRMQDMLRISEDPSQLLPQDQRFQVTQRICVQINNVETVRSLISERAEMLYNLYQTIYDGPLKPLPGTPDERAKKSGEDDWIADRFQHSLLAIRSVSDGLLNELCSGLLPFIESMLFFILRMYRGDDGKVRNEGNRIMSKLTSKAAVSNEEVSQEMEPIFEFLDYSVEVLSKNLYYAVFKKFVRTLWNGISRMLEDALLPHAEKHFMKPDQIAKFLCVGVQFKDYFTYDGESLPEDVANDSLHYHQLTAASLTKPTSDILEMMDTHQPGQVTALLTRLLRLRAENKDARARDWLRRQDLGISTL